MPGSQTSMTRWKCWLSSRCSSWCTILSPHCSSPWCCTDHQHMRQPQMTWCTGLDRRRRTSCQVHVVRDACSPAPVNLLPQVPAVLLGLRRPGAQGRNTCEGCQSPHLQRRMSQSWRSSSPGAEGASSMRAGQRRQGEEANAASQTGVAGPMAVTPVAQAAIHDPDAAMLFMPLMQTLSAWAMGTEGVKHGPVSRAKQNNKT